MLPFGRACTWVLRANGVNIPKRLGRVTACKFSSVEQSVDNTLAAPTTSTTEPDEDPTAVVSNEITKVNTRQPYARKIWNKSILMDRIQTVENQGSGFSSSAVYRFLKCCGKEMHGETPQVKIQLVKDVWNRLKESGVTLDVTHYNALLSTYVYNGHNFSPFDFLAEMQENSIQPNYVTFIHLVDAFCSKGDMQGALKVVELMSKENLSLSEIVYASLIQGYSNAGDLANAEEILSIMRENDCEPGVNAYTALLCCHAQTGDIAAVNKTLQDMAFNKITPEASTHVALLDSLCKGGHSNFINQVMETIPDIPNLKEDIIDLAQIVVSRGDYEGAFELLNCFNERQHEQKLDKERLTRIFLAKVYGARKSASEFLKAMKFLSEKEMITAPVEETLNYCHWINDTDGALSMVHELIATEREIKPHYFYPIVKTLADNKDFEGLKNVFTLLGEKLLVDDSIITYIKSGLKHTENVDQIIGDLARQSGVQFPRRTAIDLLKSSFNIDNTDTLLSIIPSISYKYILDGDNFVQLEGLLKRAFDADKAAQVYKILHDKKIVRIGSSILRLLNHITSETSQVPAKDAVKFIKLLMEKGIPLQSRTYTKTLAVIHINRLKEDFFEMVRLMKEHDIQADEHQYIQMLKMSAYIGNSAAAQFCFDKIKQSSVQLNPNMYGNLITAYWEDNDSEGLKGLSEEHMMRISEVYELMKEKQMTPPNNVISTIIMAFLQQRRIDDADEVLKEYGPGYKQGLVYNGYLRAYAYSGRIEDAEKLFDWMKTTEDAPKPQHAAYHHLISAFRMEGNVEKVRELMDEMNTHGLQHRKLTNMELVKSYLQRKDFDGALDSLEAVEDVEAYPYDVLYRRVTRELKLAHNIPGLLRAKEIFKKQNVTNAILRDLDSLIAFLMLKDGKADDAIQYLQSDNWRGSAIETKRIMEEFPSDSIHLETMKKIFSAAGKATYVFDHPLLRHYVKTNNVEAALLLYKEKMESGQDIAESFLTRLEDLLKANNKEMPTYPVSFGKRALAYVTGMLQAYIKLV